MLQSSNTRNTLNGIKTVPLIKKVHFLVKERGACFPSILNDTKSAEKTSR